MENDQKKNGLHYKSLLEKYGLKHKLFLTFIAVSLIVVSMVLTTQWRLSSIKADSDRIVDVRVPTSLASQRLINGINGSLANLRGWMLLHDEKFVVGRRVVWKIIDDQILSLKQLSSSWTSAGNIKNLETLEMELAEFRKGQQQVEAMVNTSEEFPANKILFEKAAPIADKIVNLITQLINIEAGSEATKARKALLKSMADFRGSMAMSLANIRAFLLSGDVIFKEKFNKMWQVNNRSFEYIETHIALLSSEQKKAFEPLQKYRQQFSGLPLEMFTVRQSKQWNMSNYLLATQAAPRAEKILAILEGNELDGREGMTNNQISLLKQDASSINDEISNLNTMEWFLLVLALAVMIVLSVLVVNNISGNVQIVSEQLKSASAELESVAQQQASSASQQTSSVTELSATAEELVATAKQIAKNSGKVSDGATLTAGVSNESKLMVDNAQLSMNKTKEQVQLIAQHMLDLGNKSQRIGIVLEIINELSEQTNLLSINATIEAAGAGDAGKRFSVVADEVRKLAERSREATTEIKNLIFDIQQTANTTIMVTEDGGKAVDESVYHFNEVLDAIKRTEDQAELTSTATKEIGLTTRQQTTSVEQVSVALNELSSASRHTETSAKQVLATVKMLTDMIFLLESVVKGKHDLS